MNKTATSLARRNTEAGAIQNKYSLHSVRALVCEPNSMIKQGVRIGLNNLGIRDITEANTFVAAHNAFANERFEMVVMNAEIDATDTTYLLRETRLGRLGKDPFVVGAMLLASTEEARVHSCVNSGADDLLLIPFSPDQIATRLGAFAARRKPFVVTHDYLGPDRRKQPRPGLTSAAAFTVPNPVQARALGAVPDRYDSQKNQIFGALSLERIKRLAAGCEWECKTLLDKVREGTHTPEMILRGAYNLENLIGELMERVARDLRHGTESLEALLAKSAEIKNRPSAASIGEFDSLHTAARRIATTYTGG